MNHYSQDQLSDKIHAFIDGKIDKYPELANEQYYIEHVTAAEPDRMSRGQMFSFSRTSAQY